MAIANSSGPTLEPSTGNPRRNPDKLTLLLLVIATFFMVSGGTYGTEDIVRGAGYLGGIALLIVTPLIWSVPTALMLGELASAIPAEGGFYVWSCTTSAETASEQLFPFRHPEKSNVHPK